jgi:hypothetical protein
MMFYDRRKKAAILFWPDLAGLTMLKVDSIFGISTEDEVQVL